MRVLRITAHSDQGSLGRQCLKLRGCGAKLKLRWAGWQAGICLQYILTKGAEQAGCSLRTLSSIRTSFSSSPSSSLLSLPSPRYKTPITLFRAPIRNILKEQIRCVHRRRRLRSPRSPLPNRPVLATSFNPSIYPSIGASRPYSSTTKKRLRPNIGTNRQIKSRSAILPR